MTTKTISIDSLFFAQTKKDVNALSLAEHVTCTVLRLSEEFGKWPHLFCFVQMRDTNRMVEEMMLLANTTVAEKILAAFPSCACLRRHPPPNSKKFEGLLVALESAGISLDLTSSKTLADSLDKAVMPTDPFFNTLVRMMTTRYLTEVQISTSVLLLRTSASFSGTAA